MIDLPVVLLPEPDSPTSPTVLPLGIVNEILSTARFGVFFWKNQ